MRPRHRSEGTAVDDENGVRLQTAISRSFGCFGLLKTGATEFCGALVHSEMIPFPTKRTVELHDC